MSNEAHVQVVRKILARSKDFWEKECNKMPFADFKSTWIENQPFVASLLDRCTQFWVDELRRSGINIPLDLSGADLSGGLFACEHYASVSYLCGANLRDACLDNTEWISINLEDADFNGASLRNSFIFGAVCYGTNFRNTDLSGAHLLSIRSAPNKIADFTNANLSNAQLLSHSFIIVLDGANLDNCRVTSAQVSNEKDLAGANEALEKFVARLSDEQRKQIILEASTVKERGCFIATVATGSDQADEVIWLKAFREVVLRQNQGGRMLITIYELLSPPLARYVSCSPLIRSLIKRTVVRPTARLSRLVLHHMGDEKTRHT